MRHIIIALILLFCITKSFCQTYYALAICATDYDDKKVLKADCCGGMNQSICFQVNENVESYNLIGHYTVSINSSFINIDAKVYDTHTIGSKFWEVYCLYTNDETKKVDYKLHLKYNEQNGLWCPVEIILEPTEEPKTIKDMKKWCRYNFFSIVRIN